MSGFQNEEIARHIASSNVLSVKYADLQKTLHETLKIEFTLAVGFQIPTASEAEFLSIESVIKFETELKMDEFLSGASNLATQAFTDDEAEIATTATRVAALALKNVFSLGGFSFGGGYSERFDHEGKPYICALYVTPVVPCPRIDWATREFYAAMYVFTVFEVPG